MKVQTWLANELTFTSTKKYENPFEDVTLDVCFACGRKTLRIPAFWDGGDTWRVRFALPSAGVWNYKTECDDPENNGLAGSGTVECEAYSGPLEIYKHGFIKVIPNVRYFVYDDGTPFFYLGDTHWNFAVEEFDVAGEFAGDLKTNSHFKYIVDKRAEQGFNVYQSEPIGAKYHIGNGVDEEDIKGFQDLDRRFAYIAEKGLVHANAQLVFPHELVQFERYEDTAYLEKLARYWAARYSAYPVLWTLGQEVDNDFYFTRGDQKRFTKENNPFKIIARGLHKNDAYKHPLTAHMEYCSIHSGPGGDGTCPSTSSFREVEGHNWFGYQWSTGLGSPMSFEFAKDGMLNGQGKVCILYESRYDHLWTKHFGARAEGWFAYLNGLYGYGYGAIDIWLYKSRYDIDKESNDGAEVITPEDKQIPWSKSVEFETAYQVNYMREFFQKLKWWRLIPRFDSPAYFKADGENFYSIATDERNTEVIYFYNQNYATGMLNNLDACEYTYQWFNPRTNEYLQKHKFTPDVHRSYHLEQKPDKNDWVILIQKIK